MSQSAPPSSSGAPAADVPRGATDPLTWALFRVLRDLPAADRLYVYRALAARVGPTPTGSPERLALVTNALTLCMEEIGRPPSRRAYDEWRQGKDKPEEFPSSGMIRNTFTQRWSKALEAIGVEPSPDILARRLRKIHESYSFTDMIEAIRACVEAVKPDCLPFSIYRSWAVDELRNPDRELHRIPLSSGTFNRAFGSWGKALAAAGHAPLLYRTTSAGRVRARGPAREYTRDAMVEAMREARACRPEGKALGCTTYDSWRRDQLDRARAEGEALTIPGAQTITRRFGSWPDALHAAGLLDEKSFKRARRQRPRRMTDDEVLTSLVQALKEVGRTGDGKPGLYLRRAEYQRWRRAKIDAHGPEPEICSDMLIWVRFGEDWSRALGAANGVLEARDLGTRP